MTSPITPDDMAVYRATARRQQERQHQALRQRQARAWELAQRAARLLKAQFGPAGAFGQKVTVLN